MAQQTFSLEIIKPHTSETIEIRWVEIESPTGSFLVGPDHSPLISLVKRKSIFTYKNVAEEEITHVNQGGGIFEVANNIARIILEQ